MPANHLEGLERCRAAIAELGIEGTIVHPGAPMATVPLAAAAVGCLNEQIIKTVVFLDDQNRTIVGIANGTGRIDRDLLAGAVGAIKVRLADPETVLVRTGYPAGGVSPIGIRDQAVVIAIDPAVLVEEAVFGGAGTEDDLLLLASSLLVQITSAQVAKITSSPVSPPLIDT